MRYGMKWLNVTLILWLAAVLAFQAQAQEGIVQDPVTGDFVITYIGSDGTLKQETFVPSSKIDEQLKSAFQQTPTDTILYDYKIENGSQGEQTIVGLAVTANSIVDGSQVTPATSASWRGVMAEYFQASGFRVGWLQVTSDPVELALSPGSGPSNFAFESNDLPGVGIMELQGNSPVLAFEDEGPTGDLGDELFELEKADFVSRHAAVPTIPVPEPFDAAAILGDIQNHVQDLIGMALVEPVFAGQLDGLFTAARNAFALDDIPTALSHLTDLQALITEEAGEDQEWDSEETASPTLLITQLAARVLLFDIGFVLGQFDIGGGTFLVIDEDSISTGNPPNSFSSADVNEGIAGLGQRTQLAFFAANAGNTITLHTGEVGDEGWFAVKTIPDAWVTTGPTNEGLRNYVGNPSQPFPHNVGPGLGAGNDPEEFLDEIPDVTPLRATGLKMLEGQQVCGVVYKSDISINYDPLNGSLKGDTLGTVAFEVLSVTQLTGGSSSALPKVDIQILNAEDVCEAALLLFTDAPEPISSSEPFDIVP